MYEVEREYGQWHIRERGQTTRGTTVTDAWLEQMGFGTLTKANIDHVVRAAAAGYAGMVLDPAAARRIPKDIGFTPGFRSYPSEGRGTKPRTKMHIPERMLFRT